MRNIGQAAIIGASFLALAAPVRAEWRMYEARHFQIISESGEAKATELAARLERYDKLMRMATGIADDTPMKVRVYEVPSTDEIEKALGVSNTGIAGFYSSNNYGPFLLTPRKVGDAGRYFTPLLVLQHEYAHHFMLQYFPATYPGWYIEGFAELIGSSTMEDDGTIRYGEPARQRGNQLAANWVSLQELLARDIVRDFDNYGQGWAITHYLTMDKDRAAQLRRYLLLLNNGKSNREAASTAFGDLAKLNAAIRSHVSRGQWTVRAVKPEIPTPVISSSRALTAAEIALMPELMALDDDPLIAMKGSSRDREAQRRRSHYARVKEKAARFPGDPFALSLLAEAAALNGDKPMVDDATRRLLAANPNDAKGLVRRSLLLAEEAGTLSGAERTAKAAEARALAVKANRSNPDDPLPLFAFYQSFRLAGATPTPTAVTGLENALATLPGNEEIRLVLVEEYARTKRYAEAMDVLGPLANSPHDTPQRQGARERMAQLAAAAGTATGAKTGAAERGSAPNAERS